MELMEKIEKLREKANVSYEEAKMILTETDGDLLEAMILLEQQGRVAPPPGTAQSRADTQQPESEQSTSNGHLGWQDFVRWFRSLIRRGNRNTLLIRRQDEVIGSIPVTVFAAALLFAFWVTLPILVIGLFCGCSYSFKGPDLEKENINKAWDKASEMAESIKADFQQEMHRQNAESSREDK